MRHLLPYFKLYQVWHEITLDFAKIHQWPRILSSWISFPFSKQLHIFTCQNLLDNFLHFKLNLVLFPTNFINDKVSALEIFSAFYTFEVSVQFST